MLVKVLGLNGTDIQYVHYNTWSGYKHERTHDHDKLNLFFPEHFQSVSFPVAEITDCDLNCIAQSFVFCFCFFNLWLQSEIEQVRVTSWRFPAWYVNLKRRKKG